MLVRQLPFTAFVKDAARYSPCNNSLLGSNTRPAEVVVTLTMVLFWLLTLAYTFCRIFSWFGIKIYNYLIIHYNLARKTINHTSPVFQKVLTQKRIIVNFRIFFQNMECVYCLMCICKKVLDLLQVYPPFS
jgi:hypothetical protein